jgi:hypothetical protein
MMIKVSNDFLDFAPDVEMERQIKLFEDISTTDGDFSYSFEIPKTIKNTRLLQNPFPDNINKPVYQQIPALLLGDSGAELYDGYIRVERVTNVYHCSFFAGNNNWFSMITGLLSDLDLSAYDIEQTRENIVYSWTRTEGIVFPLLDHGALLRRSFPQVKIEDLIGGFYIKTIFNKVFAEAGIKIQGELLNDWRFNNTICLRNSKSQEEIDARSAYIHTTSTPRTFSTETDVLWENDSTFPYFDGSKNNFNLATNTYTADMRMVLRVEAETQSQPHAFEYVEEIYIYVNGSLYATNRSPQGNAIASINELVTLEQGDQVKIRTWYGGINPATYNLIEGTVKFTPIFLYKTFGKSAVPNWTKQDFISNILRLFNVIANYDEGNSTLTLNLFETIKSKTPVDLSPYISEVEVDYSDFISSYGQRTKLSYSEVDFEELKEYNVAQYFKYGQGVINVSNDFIESDADAIESDFANPIAYLNGVFSMSMEKTNLLSVDEGDNTEVTSVTDNSGTARLNITDDLFLVGDLVRIEESTNSDYNGEWIVSAVSAGWVELQGVSFDTDATATITKLDYTYGNSDDVFLFINIHNYSLANFSGVEAIYLEDTTESNWGVGYFDLIYTNKQINFDFIYSLSFGGIDDPLHYQVTMIDSYFRLFSQVLNDPVKLLCTCHIPYALFVQLDFLSPITIRTIETTNEYYLNRISGYKESYLPCTLELIKI